MSAPDMTQEELVAAALAASEDPKVAAAFATYREAKTMHSGTGGFAGSAETYRVTVQMARDAWVAAVREHMAA